MDDRRTELDRFKRTINLSEYAASIGYELDAQASSRNSAVMRDGAGDKIVIARALETGHWIYFSVRNERDNGTIVDFLQNRCAASLGEVRKLLRPWIGESAHPRPRSAARRFAESLEPQSRDQAAVQATFARCVPESSHYLHMERGITTAVQTDPRFAGTIFRDSRRNTIFPHRDGAGVCGFEIKNTGFTGFAKGGEKGLWSSRAFPGDDTAVFAETAIDALSYFALEGHARMRLFSTGGALNPRQPDLITRAVQRLADRGCVIIATDNDEGGDQLAEAIFTAAERAGREDLTLREHRPQRRGADWNDVLRQVQTDLAPEP